MCEQKEEGGEKYSQRFILTNCASLPRSSTVSGEKSSLGCDSGQQCLSTGAL